MEQSTWMMVIQFKDHFKIIFLKSKLNTVSKIQGRYRKQEIYESDDVDRYYKVPSTRILFL